MQENISQERVLVDVSDIFSFLSSSAEGGGAKYRFLGPKCPPSCFRSNIALERSVFSSLKVVMT